MCHPSVVAIAVFLAFLSLGLQGQGWVDPLRERGLCHWISDVRDMAWM
jgi:hypothetical protein